MVIALICGGGNGAHTLAGIVSSHPSTEARVLTLYADEAQRWTKEMENNNFVTRFYNHDKTVTLLNTKPKLVTKDPQNGAKDADIILITVPAFVHRQYLEALKPFVKPGVIIVGLPGQPGFAFDVQDIWGDLASKCTLMSFESLPWACRIETFGRCIDVLGTKESLAGAISHGTVIPKYDPVSLLQGLLGPHPCLLVTGHILGMSLSVNAYIHSSILYGKWSNWDSTPVDEPPLFYTGIDEKSAELMSGISDEVLAVVKTLMNGREDVDLTNVPHVLQWYLRVYEDDITDKSNLCKAIQTNAAYEGLKHPMVKTEEGKFVPDFKHRYITEAIPYGFAVVKGIAEVAGVPTPLIDKVLIWSQKQIGMEILVNGKMEGKDVELTRCPQRYGITTVEAMLGL